MSVVDPWGRYGNGWPALEPDLLKPYRVQAYTPGHFTAWHTDSRRATVEDAIAHANRLATDWHRKVRVVGPDDVLLYQFPPKKTRTTATRAKSSRHIVVSSSAPRERLP